MVWSQYRTWASEGTEVETSANNSDDDRNEDDPYLNINTFYDSYSEQLQFLYDMFRNMIHQAYLDEPTSDFSDFLDMCYHYPPEENREKQSDHVFADEYVGILQRLREHDAKGLLTHVDVYTFTLFATDDRTWAEKYISKL